MPLAAIVGHASLVQLLGHAVTANRVPQSLLFAGPDGVGKKATALALAQAINCPQRRDGDACGRCNTCQRIARNQHADVVLIDKGDDASIKIGAIRERLVGVVGYRPFEAAKRICIIDGADDMGISAQDALLKTLEEPPPSAVIILVSAYAESLNATVRSRCRRLRFGALSTSDVQRVLIERCGLPADKAPLLAAASGGSVSHALAMDDGNLIADRDVALDLLVTASRDRTPAGRLKMAAALAQHPAKRRSRETLSARLDAAASLLRDLAVIETIGAHALANADLEDDLKQLARAYDLDRLSAGFAALAAAQQALSRNAGTKIVADWISLAL